jgi:hypothetical protein
MGQLRALREAGGAGRVEDASVSVGIDRNLRHRVLTRDHLLPWRDVCRGIVEPHADQPDAACKLRLLPEPRQPLGIEEQRLGLRIPQCKGHFFGGPPGVHAHHRDPGCDAGPIDQHPFGIVAHRDRHPVPGTHALHRQPCGDCVHLRVRFRIAQPLVFIDDIGPLGEYRCRKPQFAHGRRLVLVGADAIAEHFGFGNFKRPTGACQQVAHLVQFFVIHASPDSLSFATGLRLIAGTASPISRPADHGFGLENARPLTFH